MILQSRKRKHKFHSRPYGDHHATTSNDAAEHDPALFIQAYEADITRGPQGVAAAQSLEVEHADGGTRVAQIGDGLIRWNGNQSRGESMEFEEDSVYLGHREDNSSKAQPEEDQDAIWMDRYDARLLLDTLPLAPTPAVTAEPSSPTGWSDLPSDAEDTFFFTQEEAEDYGREKRRRLFDRNREERLKALRAEERDDEEVKQEEWGGSDEEPDDRQRELMQRTAAHVLSSPNPAQLEMRILANHGADRRFAFLRGRWSRTWKTAKSRVRLEMENENAEKLKQARLGSLGGLAGYGDSDEDNDEEAQSLHEAEGAEETKAIVLVDTGSAAAGAPDADDDVRRARRARAKEWAEKRRASQANGEHSGS